MTAIAVAIYAAFGTIALGMRSVVHRRVTGRWPIVLPRGAPAWIAQILSSAGIVGAALGAALDLSGHAPRLAALDHAILRIGGLVFLSLGCAFVLLAQRTMGSSWRIGTDPFDRTELVTTGLFAWVRNPIYSSTILVTIGVALVAGNWICLAAVALTIIAAEVLVRGVEEPHLLTIYGEKWTAYKSATGRFVPRPKRR